MASPQEEAPAPEAPAGVGPGTWEMDAEHFAHAIPPLVGEVFEAAFPAGMRLTCEDGGLLLDTIATVVVDGFPYMQPRPIGAPPGAKDPPPWLMKLLLPVLVRAHPALRQRLATARTLFEQRPWRMKVAEWDATLRDHTVALHAAVSAVDTASLDDEALARHVERVRDHAIAVLTQDHGLNGTTMIPMGDFLVRVGGWTGRDEAELMQALRGSSAISSGDSRERRRLVAALHADPAARAVLDGAAADPAGALSTLAGWPGQVGEATRAWQLITGNAVVMGIDIRHPTVSEDPRQMLAALRITVASPASAPSGLDPARVAALRALVPEAHREEFDVLFEDACAVYRLRDERHIYGALPVLGLARKSVLEMDRRLLERGAIERAGDAMLCHTAELAALLRGEVVEIDWIGRRRIYTASAHQVPHRLGPPGGAPPDPDWLPAPMARVMRALDAYMRAVNGRAGEPATGETIEGMAVSRGVHEGIARICLSAEDLERVAPGEVLVAPLTSSAINVVLPILGAIVTDRGGALSHAAIVSREFGIPGVVGARDATRRIKEGDRVRVDGDRGVVVVLGR